MLDPKWIRSEPDALAQRLRKKKFTLDVDHITKLDTKRREIQLETESLQNERNARSKEIGKAKAEGKDIGDILKSMDSLKEALESKKELLSALQDELNEYMLGVPNVPDEAVPDGDSEEDNQVVSTWGTPAKYGFEVKDHAELGEALQHGLDFAAASKLTGSRFVVMQGATARLHRALIQFMLDTHTQDHGDRKSVV